MTTTAAERFRRIVTILPHVAHGRAVRIDALAEQTGIAPDALINDLQLLAERYDLPAAFVEGVAVAIDGDSVSVRTDHFRRPMRLTAAELCALELGVSLLASERSGDQAVLAARLRESLKELIVALPRDAVFAGLREGALMDSGCGDVLAVIRKAIRAGRVVLMSYQSGAATEATERHLHPHALVFSNGCWFVIGWCERTESMRMFRADRIASVTLTAQTFERADESLLDAVMVDGKPFLLPNAEQLTVRYGPAIARWIAERMASRWRPTDRRFARCRWPTGSGPSGTCCSTVPTPRSSSRWSYGTKWWSGCGH